jgi:hypothetical protein
MPTITPVWRGRPTIDGNTARGASSPAKPKRRTGEQKKRKKAKKAKKAKIKKLFSVFLLDDRFFRFFSLRLCGVQRRELTGLAHARAVVNDQCLNFLLHN